MSTKTQQRPAGTSLLRRRPRSGRGATPSSSRELPVLYVKSGCIWCAEVVNFLESHGIDYREKNVNDDARAYAEMKEKSGQSRAPTLDWHGTILADFGVEELKPFLRAQEVQF